MYYLEFGLDYHRFDGLSRAGQLLDDLQLRHGSPQAVGVSDIICDPTLPCVSGRDIVRRPCTKLSVSLKQLIEIIY